ncbi:Protein GIGANTEA [Acorus calamus]|uniref:Protein GIGANTEA n=1 Tax=Acorus calamus TaxID=4465 RepID=A0AAV9DDY5_ACOCL|nr:Protein GIGANTEA [Acorus calamus]
MSVSNERWIDGLQFSSLFWPPPQDSQQREGQTMAYVEFFGQFTSERFPEDVAEKEYSEQWALACGEILRVLTHYNRPIYKAERQNNEIERSNSGNLATTSDCRDGKTHQIQSQEHERKPLRPLSPWITDILLTAPLGIRSDYFRWCGGVMGKYAAGGELKPPSTASGRGSGKHPQLMPSTPRWAVANGAGVILSVCDEEVARYETANLTAAAVPALLLPPPTTPLDEHLVAGLPALEPYARLFHRYYAIATPSATLRLLLGLLEAPPSWAPDALDAAVQLVELLRAAEDYASGMKQLPRNWMHLHFLRAIGTAMSMRAGIAADAAAALLFRILSQPTLLFPPLRQAEGVDILQEPFGGHTSSYRKQIAPAEQASIEATAQGIASMLCAHGPDVEWKICTIWEAAYGLLPLSSSAVDLPEIIVATPLQPPVLSWNLYLPLLKVLEYLPRGSPSEACLMRIFVATVEAILRRTFPPETSPEENKKSRAHGGMWSTSKNLAVAELRTMVHSLFLESCASMDLASRLLFVVLTVCVSHEALPNGSKKPAGGDTHSPDEITENQNEVNGKVTNARNKNSKKQGPVAAFDSYVLAAVCALACELQLFPLISKASKSADPKNPLAKSMKINGTSNELQNGISSAVCHTRRILGILEALFSLKPSSVGTTWNYSSNEIVAAAMVAAHVSELFGRSKACMHALSVLMRCKWDAEIYTRASSLYHLIDIHGKVVASIVNKAEPLEAYLVRVPPWKDSPACFNSKKRTGYSCSSNFDSEQSSTSQSNGDGESTRSGTFLHCEKALLLTDVMLNTSEKALAGLPVDASDLANFLTMDRHIGFNCSAQELLRETRIMFLVVSLLWHKMIAAPETQMSEESTSAQQGWRQVVVALCNVAMASPAKASTAVVLQAERDLQPWIARDDEQGQKMWRINQRIVKLIAELMRNHDSAESIIILASASDLLLRATDGMLVDGEACTLPQLELLEATARAVQLVFDWGESGSAVTDSLSNLLKCRLPATIRCLSHPSAHVRALSTSVLREILHSAPPKPPIKQEENNINNIKGMSSPPYPCLNVGIIDWPSDVEKCLMWEAHSRRPPE